MKEYESRARNGLVQLNERLLPGTLWGHGTRGLVWNPIFALLPAFYLQRFGHTSGPTSYFWLFAFILGFPHAGYTAMEVKHFFDHDGVADARTFRQGVFFASYGVLGAVASVWYIARGAEVIGVRFQVAPMLVAIALALAGSIGTVIGLQDVLVMDLLLRPGRVARSALRAISQRRWLRLTLTLATLQLTVAMLILLRPPR